MATGSRNALVTNYASIDGVRADVLEYRPFVPFEPFRTRATSAWVMLSKAGVSQFAQVGWYEWSTNYRKVFVQYWNGTGYPIFEWNPNPDNTYSQYYVTYTNNAFYFRNRGTQIKSTPAAFNPDQGEIASEITNLVNQMPGDYGAHAWMSYHNMERRLAGSWQNYSPNLVGTSDNTKWYSSNARGGMNPQRDLVTADKRGDCS